MNQGEHEPSHKPLPDAKATPLAYLLGLQFHPPIKLVRKVGFEFAAKLSGIIDTSGLNLQENSWVFSQAIGSAPGGVFNVSIGASSISMEAALPSDSQEWFERRYDLILGEFGKFFSPQLILGSSACVRATMQVNGDARTFLGAHVTNLSPDRLLPLGRPVHLLGIRLMMPPFQSLDRLPNGKGKKPKVVKSADWMVDVKAESLIEDTSKLFLEASANWPEPKQWNDASTKEIVGRIQTVSEFLNEKFITFLRSASGDE